MKITVITSGGTYVDIDIYASCIAYREFLAACGRKAFAVSSAPLTASVPEVITSIPLIFDNYKPSESDDFIILDVSDPAFFNKIVNHKNIIEIIDHHPGHEDFWRKRAKEAGVKVQIEPIGSVATIIYEKFVGSGLENKLTADLCKLLTAAIADNTLNLKASITNQRDITAYSNLLKLGGLDETWTRQYLENCEMSILGNLRNAIISDTKNMTLEKLPQKLGQLALYNHEKVLSRADTFREAFAGCDDWAVNIISLKEGRNYIFAENEKSKAKLEKLFGKSFEGAVMRLDKLYLRKEIVALAQSVL